MLGRMCRAKRCERRSCRNGGRKNKGITAGHAFPLTAAKGAFHDIEHRMYNIAYSKSALHVLKRAPAREQRRILAAIADYAARPESRSHQAKKLKSRGAYRLRIGKWRAIFDLDGNNLRGLAVGPRGCICS